MNDLGYVSSKSLIIFFIRFPLSRCLIEINRSLPWPCFVTLLLNYLSHIGYWRARTEATITASVETRPPLVMTS